ARPLRGGHLGADAAPPWSPAAAACLDRGRAAPGGRGAARDRPAPIPPGHPGTRRRRRLPVAGLAPPAIARQLLAPLLVARSGRSPGPYAPDTARRHRFAAHGLRRQLPGRNPSRQARLPEVLRPVRAARACAAGSAPRPPLAAGLHGAGSASDRLRSLRAQLRGLTLLGGTWALGHLASGHRLDEEPEQRPGQPDD